MREAAICRWKSILFAMFISTFLVAVSAWAVPPEGLEAFGIIGKAGKGFPRLLYVEGGYDSPSWMNGYEFLESYTSIPTSNGDYWSFGGFVSTGTRGPDRDAYFARYDLTFLGAQSISLKLAHDDLNFIPAGKNIISLDYNAAFNIGKAAQFYILAGAYYRFNLNSWNTPLWSPINFNTEDQDGFVEVCFGSKISINQSSYATVDLNNRDPFLAYNGDNIAIDFTLNASMGQDFWWRLAESTRFSGLLVGTADVGEVQVLTGVMFNF